MLEVLRPFFRNEWAQYGESLRLAETHRPGTCIARQLSDTGYLSAVLRRHATHLEDAQDLKAVVSDWSLRYLAALLPPVVALTSLLKHSVPSSWYEMTVMLNAHGTAELFSIAQLGEASPDAAPTARYEDLVWQHLEPLFAMLASQTGVPIKILRGNARRALLGIFSHALDLLGYDAPLSAALLEDRNELLESRVWPGGRRNPLFMHHRRVLVHFAEGDRSLTLHASCCLAYRLPRTGYCGACPLALPVSKERQRRDLDMARASIRRSPLLGG